MENYLVSIVIPTKNRYATLFPLVESLKKICLGNQELELVIHDNSEDNNDAIVFFESINCPNIKYVHSAEWLSVGDNSDKAILLSSGEFVSFIGDDDAIVPEIIEIARWMKKYNIDSCGCDYSLYRWPTALIKGNNSFEYKASNEIYREIDCKKKVKNIMKNGIQSKKDLPGVYHGLVKRAILDKIFEKTGTFFPGPSPDMANAFALSMFVHRHVMINIPFIIDGYSKASTGYLTEAKKHIGKLEDQPFLPKDTIEKWTEVIPKIWLPNTIWPESAIQALKRCGKIDIVNDFNYTAMYIKISAIYPQCKSICKEYQKKYTTAGKYILTYLMVILKYFKNRLMNYKEIFSKYAVFIKKEMSISEAITMSSNIIRKKNMIEILEKFIERKRQDRRMNEEFKC